MAVMAVMVRPVRRTPSPAMRSASPQLAMWHAPPQRPEKPMETGQNAMQYDSEIKI
jgi:hypothetical protein